MSTFPIFVVQMTEMHYSADWSCVSLNSTFRNRLAMSPGKFVGCGILERCMCEWHIHLVDAYPAHTNEEAIVAQVINIHRSYPNESVGFVFGTVELHAKPILDFTYFNGIT